VTTYDNRGRGALFRHDEKTGDQPDYRGNITTPDGTEYWLSGWLKTAKKTGRKYFSLSMQPKEEQPKVAAPGPGGARPSLKDELDDEIPF
jgi:hypothetical protein